MPASLVPPRMTAIIARQPGGPEVLSAVELPTPTPGAGEVLVQGGSGGVGSAAIQIASGLGHTVIATAGNETKCARCRELGAQAAIVYREGDDFTGAVLAATAGDGVDLVLDCLGGGAVQQNLT